MGCDIHGPFLFAKYDTKVRPRLAAKFHWDRDYYLFALLANVRNDDSLDGFEPRGFPMDWLDSPVWELGIGVDDPSPDCDGEHGEYHGEDADCHSMSWLSTDELITVQQRYVATTGGPEMELARAIVFMRSLEREHVATSDYEVRLLFCFDN